MDKFDVFDFDKTLYKKDSTIQFYLFCLKKKICLIKYLPIQFAFFVIYKIGLCKKEIFKEKFFGFIKGIEDIDKFVNDFWNENKKDIRTDLLKGSNNKKIVISASPEFLLKKICGEFEIDEVIASKVNSKTGKFESKNCYGEEKVHRLNELKKDYTIENFYTDSYSDKPLADISKNSYLIENGKAKEFKKKDNNKVLKYIIAYTLVFAFLFICCFAIHFIKAKKSFFRSFDGLDQHYLIFLECGKWIREIFRNIFIRHTFSIPLWNNGIGYGADILTTNGAYFPDIFNWISCFFPSKYAEIGYNLMIILKIYAVGLSFSYLCFYRKRSFYSTLIGTIIYTFSGVVFIVFIESFFINPMYILPIVIVGCDKLLKEKKSTLYVFSLAYAFINYFYFAYMISIIVFIYCVLTFIFDKEITKNVKNFFTLVSRVFIFSLLGVGISMIVTLPILLVMFNVGRIGLKTYIPNLYSVNWYKDFFSGFLTSMSMSGRDAYIGFGALSLVCIIIVFSFRKKYTKQKIEFLLETIGLCLPIVGSMMNGFSYYANRWSFVYALTVSYMVCLAIENIKDLNKKQKKIVVIATLVYVGIIELIFKKIEFDIILSAFYAIVIAITFYKKEDYSNNKFNYAIIVMAIISVIIPSYFEFDLKHNNLTKNEVEYGTAYKKVMNNGGIYILNKVEKDNVLRYDVGNDTRVRNASWLYGISGEDLYISIYNNNIDKFHNNIAMIGTGIPMDYHGLHRRSEIEAIVGVNHFIIKKGEEYTLPYGFDKIEKENEIYAVYNSNNSVVYGFDNSISQSEYEKLNPIEKQQALMKSIVVDDKVSKNKLEDISIENYEINYDTIYNNVQSDGKNYIVRKNENNISLKLNDIKDGELYVYFDNIDYRFKEKSFYNIGIKAYDYKDNKYSVYTSIYGLNYKSHMYGGKHRYLVNLGKIENTINSLDINFEIGNYLIDNIKVFFIPKEKIIDNINNLDRIATNLSYKNNEFNFNINLDKEKYVFIAVPYSSGWKVKANGKDVKPIKANDAFIAIKLEKGDYKISMKYFTPGLKEGIIITIISLLIYLSINRFYIKTRRQNET